MKISNIIMSTYHLGKGEVHSSILCGGTIQISSKQAILAEPA
jgi:hypothetical protein